MPTTSFQAPRQGDIIQNVYDFLLTGKRPATYLFVSMLGAFLLLLSLGVSPLIAAGGALAVTFCSYNLQIIQVGHNTKMQALAFLPWALAALVFTYRNALEKKKYLAPAALGAVLFGLGISLQVKANHQQITYYLALLILIYAITVFVYILKKKDNGRLLKRFAAASAMLLVCGIAGIATNANKLIPIYNYTAHSMRGGSPLLSEESDGSKGLSLDYATAWSYGWEELPNMMIPNYNGGASAGAVNPKKSETYALLKSAGQSNLKQVAKNLPLYWGPQPFTAGPMYMGAISIFLFLLGLFLYEGKEKWWLLAGTILAILLSLGSNLMFFTKLFYNYAPFYNKFRTVSMALTVLQFTLPVLGCLALDNIVKKGIDRSIFLRKGGIALALSAGFCVLVALIPSLAGDFCAASDASMPDILAEALEADRRTLLVDDAWRSALLIASSFVLLLWGISVPSSASETFKTQADMGKARRHTAALLVLVLAFADLFFVGKRYLNSDHFVKPSDWNKQFEKRMVDEIILEDTDPSYRVLDISVNTFNDSHPSYWHKSIGGYSPAKLQRYEDLKNHHLDVELNSIRRAIQNARTVQEAQASLPETPVLNALNTRYIIIGENNAPLVNDKAYGNAWLVENVITVENAQEEITLTGLANLRSEAVVHSEMASSLKEKYLAEGSILLTDYAPNCLIYSYDTPSEALAVFSEIWYPEGWNAQLENGESLDIIRADWTLRAAVLPAGKHTITMRFAPESYRLSRNISLASSLSLVILLLLSAGCSIAAAKKAKDSQE